MEMLLPEVPDYETEVIKPKVKMKVFYLNTGICIMQNTMVGAKWHWGKK